MTTSNFIRYIFSFLLSAFFLIPSGAQAHGGEKHGKKASPAKVDSLKKTAVAAQDTITISEMSTAEHAAHKADPAEVHASLSDFPNTHPLIVHFPIMLLMIAAAMQFVNILFLKKELNWAVTIMVLLGFVTAYASTNWSHPHTDGLTEHAELVLEQHDKYADYTVYLSGLGLLAQLLSLFLFKGRRWSIAVAAVILIGAGYAVSMAGHYGAQLVHIEGVGPQGKYLEKHH